MKYTQRKKAILLLADGTIFEGKSIGKDGSAYGEICYNTGMTGYQEVFTDPSYFGQLMLTTNAHIGNYGVNNEEIESDSIKISGLVCKNFSFNYSRENAQETLESYFEKNNLMAISDIDTRAVVRYIRDKGAMNAIISSEILDLNELKNKLNDFAIQLQKFAAPNTKFPELAVDAAQDAWDDDDVDGESSAEKITRLGGKPGDVTVP